MNLRGMFHSFTLTCCLTAPAFSPWKLAVLYALCYAYMM